MADYELVRKEDLLHFKQVILLPGYKIGKNGVIKAETVLKGSGMVCHGMNAPFGCMLL